MAGQPMLYDELSLALSVNGYTRVMEAEKPAVRPHKAHHLQELMGDTELCGSKRVRVFHAVWL